jgi:F-type H+-transporting ATPase subunit epsilon
MDTPSPSDKSLQCVVVTPERGVLDETVDFVALPMLDGELGVLPGRAPLIGRLGYGELRTVVGRTVHRYYIDGGFAQIRANVVTVLTSKAMAAEEIKLASAEEALRSALQVGLTPEVQEAHVKDQERARAQIRMAHRASGAAND